MAATQFYATGRRKESTARVFLRPGIGHDHASTVVSSATTSRPKRCACRSSSRSLLTETGDKFDVLCTVAGGGVTGQAGAIRLGIARALCEVSADNRPRLKKEGLLTRDARAKERKKYGMAGARKRFQFSKR